MQSLCRLVGFVGIGIVVTIWTISAMAQPPEQTWWVLANGSDANDGTNEETAFASIQEAIDSAGTNDLIMVGNGCYSPFWTSNKCVRIISVNGPENTIIDGGNTQRCATLGTSGQKLTFISGFTFRNGRAEKSAGGGTRGGTISNCIYQANCAGRGGGAAGGILYDSTLSGNFIVGKNNTPIDTGSLTGFGGGTDSSTLVNCLVSNNTAMCGGGTCGGTISNSCIVGNTAESTGGCQGGYLFNCRVIGNVSTSYIGGASAVMENCWIEGNRGKNGGGCGSSTSVVNCVIFKNESSTSGGGAYDATLINCTVYSNTASVSGGGVFRGSVVNSIVLGNHAAATNDICNAEIRHSCASGIGFDDGNMEADPQFENAGMADFHLKASSPCINAGLSYENTSSLDMDGNRRIKSGVIDMGAYESVQEGILGVSTARTVPGCFIEPLGGAADPGGALTFTAFGCRPFLGFYTNGVFATSNATFTWKDLSDDGILSARFDTSVPCTFYIDSANGDDENLGMTSDSSFKSIQKAINMSMDGDRIIVADGIYTPFAVNQKSIWIESVNGPETTIIDGGGDERCATLAFDTYLSTPYWPCSPYDEEMPGTWLVGVTLRNGKASNASHGALSDGGGVYGGNLKNCILLDNSAFNEGGGAYGSYLQDCLLSGNAAFRGGGAVACALANSRVTGNVASADGGGAYSCRAQSCLFADNRANDGGGVAEMEELLNCTVAFNQAEYSNGGILSSYSYSIIANCIVWGNAAIYPEWGWSSYSYPPFYYSCCTDEEAEGEDLINDDPLFVDAASLDFRLREGSPCINAGDNGYAYWSVDCAGNARIVDGTVDIGCYEYHEGHGSEVWTPSFVEVWGEWSSESVSDWPLDDEITSWADLSRLAWNARDAFVRSGVHTELPPGDLPVVLSLGAIPFDRTLLSEAELDAEPEEDHGVPVWRLHLKEISDKGGSGYVTGRFDVRVGGESLNARVENGTFNLPRYLGDEWIKAVYGAPPPWLNAEERADWLAVRARDRIECFMTLVPSESWDDYQTAMEAERESLLEVLATEEVQKPLSFPPGGAEADGDNLRMAIRWIGDAGRVRLLGTENLGDSKWYYAGYVLQPGGTGVAGVSLPGDNVFFIATRGIPDSDGDGIPDDVESRILGTDPAKKDSSGDGLTDWEKVYRYELNPGRKDTAEDGISDAEKMQRGLDPRVPASEEEKAQARRSIRYYYDEDDRLTGTWYGADGEASTTALSPAGNPVRVLNNKH